jgi:hypothetical protein
MSDNKDYMEGARCVRAYYYSQGYGSLTRNVKAEDAIKLFLPPVVEMMTPISSPLPQSRQDWIRGFKEEQINILREMEESND